MSESDVQKKENQSNDEIDIFEFCSRMWNAFVKFVIGIKDFIVSVIIFLIRKSLWIAAFAIIGALIGYAWYGLSKPYYSSFLEGNTGGLDNSVVIDHVNKLNLLTGKPTLLANFLNITEEEAKSVQSVKAFYGIDLNKDGKPDFIDFKETYNPKDTNQLRVPSFIYLKVGVFDENILPSLRNGLFRYINSNTYIKELYRIDRDQKKQLIAEIESEIRKIDSLQRSQFRKGFKTDNLQMVFMGNEPEIKLFHEEVLDLYARKQRLERDRDISDEIIVVMQDFTPLSQEENPVLHYILIFGIVMAVLGLFCSLLWQYRNTIWRLIREDSSKK